MDECFVDDSADGAVDMAVCNIQLLLIAVHLQAAELLLEDTDLVVKQFQGFQFYLCLAKVGFLLLQCRLGALSVLTCLTQGQLRIFPLLL